MRVEPADFHKLNPHCHALLSDVPLHDVWAIPLQGGGPGRSLQDARAFLFGGRRPLLVSRFEDYSRCDSPWVERSDGMTSAMIRSARRTSTVSLKPIARCLRFFRGLARARFECSTCWVTKSLSELRNAIVHAFLALALTPSPGGYTLYMAVYVKSVSRFSTLYMTLIDPFRRLMVYPALGRLAQQRWSRAMLANQSST